MVLLAPPAWREFPPSVYAASTARADASAELPHTLRGSASLPAIGSGSMLGGPHMRRRRQRLADPSRPSKAAMARARRHVWKNEVRDVRCFSHAMSAAHRTSTYPAAARTSSTYGHVMCMRMHRPCTFGAPWAGEDLDEAARLWRRLGAARGGAASAHRVVQRVGH